MSIVMHSSNSDAHFIKDALQPIQNMRSHSAFLYLTYMDFVQVVADAEAGRKGAQKALPYAVALAAALDAESPFIRPDSLVVSLLISSL